MSLFNKVKIKVKAKRNVSLTNRKYSLKNKERSAVVVGNRLVSVGGQLFESNFSGNIGDTVTVTNVGTPAAALYAQSTTGAVSSSTGGSGNVTVVSDGALATIQAHMAQGYVEGHATSPATRVYHSIKYNVVGGAGVDESNNILYMLNTVGANGGGTCVIASADGASPIHIAKTISIYYSNVHVVFPPGQVLTYEDKASLRIMGDYAQITRKVDGTAMKLHVDSTVVSNETVLELSATDTALMDAEANPALRIVRVGDKIVVRGQNDASGKSIEKDTSFVKALAKVGSYWQITCTDELDYTFKPTYPASEWPADLTTGTTIYVIEGSLLTVNSSINDTSITVADGTVFTVGDLIEVGDNRNEYAMNASAITGAGNPYKNPANLEQRQIVAISGNVLTLDNALCRSTSTTYYAFAALMVPVVNSTIVGARISYVADGIRSANALQITYSLDCHIFDCYVDGSGGRKGHGLRISYSYKCTAHRNRIENPKYSGSGEGYGITIYYATKILVDHNYVSGCRHNFLLQLATESIVSSNYSINDLISGIDLHGVYSVNCVIQNNHVTRSKLQDSDGSTKSGGIRIGNTSHSGGDHNNLIQGNYISGYRGYNNTDGNGIDIFGASSGNIIRNNTIEHCYNGLRFGLNSKQITPVQFIDNTIVEGNIFRNCENRAIEIIAAPTYDNVNSNGKFSQISFIRNISDGNNRHFEFTGVVTTLGITDLVCVGNQIINPTNVTTTYYGISAKYVDGFVHIYDNNVSKAQRGIYLQGNGVCHVVGNKTANTVQTDPFTDGTGNTSVNYVDAMSGGGSGVFGGTVSAVGRITTTSASAEFLMHNRATDLASIGLYSPTAGDFRIYDHVAAADVFTKTATTHKFAMAGPLTTNGFRVINYDTYSTGEGMHFGYDPVGNTGDITVYDYGAAAYRRMRFNSSDFIWFIAGTQKMDLDTSANLNLVGPFVAKGSTASFDLYNQATNAASIRWYSDVAGVLRLRRLSGTPTNIGTWDTDGRYQNSGGAAIARGTNTDGALRIDGTTNPSHFAYSTAEDTYIRGGKSTSDVIIGDVGSGDVTMGQAGAGVVTAVGDLTVGDTLAANNLGTWTSVSYTGTWADNGGSDSAGRYRKFGDIVYVEGVATRSGNSGLSIFTLPSGYRPQKTIWMFCGMRYSATTRICRIEINTSGVLTVTDPSEPGVPITYVALDGISFSVL